MTGGDPLSASERDEALRRAAGVFEVGAKPRERPVVYMLGGAPGSGKGRLTQQYASELRDSGGYVLVNLDDLMPFHPRYAQHAKEDTRTAAAKVHDSSSSLAAALRSRAVHHRYNVIDDGTLGDPEHGAARARMYRQAGYDVRVVYLAVDKKRCDQGVDARYESAHARWREELADGGPVTQIPRWVPRDVREAAYENGPVTVERIEREASAHRVEVVDRSGRQLYVRPQGATPQPGHAAAAIEMERRREWSPPEKRAFEKVNAEIAERAAARHSGERQLDQEVQKLARMQLERDWDKAGIAIQERVVAALRHPNEHMDPASAPEKSGQERGRQREDGRKSVSRGRDIQR